MGSMSPYRNRVERGRLWDADGQEWLRARESIGSDAELERLVASADRAVVMRPTKPLRWISGDEVRAYWKRVRAHAPRLDEKRTLTPPDAEGLTYSALLWKRSGGPEELLGFNEHC
jgi:hypothetical protein